MALNKVMLIGNVGKDPEIRSANGIPVASFPLATTEVFSSKSGQRQEHTEWHNIVVFGKTAENCSNYLKKGREVFIEGRIQTRKWQDKEGKDRYTTEILAGAVQFVGGKGEGAGAGGGSSYEAAPSPFEDLKSADEIAGGPGGGGGDVSFDDDDIPF